MCSGAAFIIGIILLLKGEFRLSNRSVPRDRTRAIALILMAPLVIGICAGLVIVSGDPELSMDTIQTVTFVELAALAIAVGLALYNVYTLPETPEGVSSNFYVPTAPRTPDIMTVSEAADYLRVPESEVLRLIDEGKLGAARIGDSYRIARRAVDDFLSRGED
jgi:excisionase family DNA binding protein